MRKYFFSHRTAPHLSLGQRRAPAQAHRARLPRRKKGISCLDTFAPIATHRRLTSPSPSPRRQSSVRLTAVGLEPCLILTLTSASTIHVYRLDVESAQLGHGHGHDRRPEMEVKSGRRARWTGVSVSRRCRCIFACREMGDRTIRTPCA
jgi:hypothetical protein